MSNKGAQILLKFFKSAIAESATAPHIVAVWQLVRGSKPAGGKEKLLGAYAQNI